MLLEENRFENILASLRVRKGWTQEDAAAHILDIGKGISRRTYIDLETGNLPPSPKHLKLIASGFKLNPADTDALYHAAHHGSPKVRNLPFHRNPLFTGRERQLERLAQLLKESYSVALSGLPGIGKTQLALEYAHKCYVEKVYSGVFWVNAADEESLQIGYAKLAEKLDLPERDEQELAKIVEAVKQWLDDHTDWLLIMDNADNLQLARSFFPEVSEDNNGHILLTTRSQMVGDVAGEIIEIDKMEPAEGLFFLLRRTRRYGRLPDKTALDTVASDIRNAASQIVELLDGHPLALDQAGAFIEDGGSFTDYIDRYHEKRLELLSERGSMDEENKGRYSEYPDTVVVTFTLCLNKACERHPLATDLLRFCAFLQPDAIPEELFQHDDSFKLDKRALRKGITALLRYSLIKRNMQEQTFSMHRLVQAVLIDDMPPDLQKQWRERVMRALDAAFPYEVEFKNWRQCKRLLPHALVCATWAADELAPTVRVAQLFHRAVVYLDARGQYSVAESLLVRVLSIYEQHLGVEHPDTATILNNLSSLYMAQDKYEQAEPHIVRAISIREEQLGVEHPDTARSLHNLAFLYFVQDKYEQAVPHIVRAISIQEEQLGAEHPDTARSLCMMAFIYNKQGNHEQAELLYRRALRVFVKHLGSDHPDIALPLYGLAKLMQDQGKRERAEALYRQALSIREQRLGATHPVQSPVY